VADVSQFPSLVEQLRLVAGLRWSLLKNSMRRKSNRWDLIGLIAAGLMSGLLVVGLCFAFYGGTYYFLTKGNPGWISLLFWGLFLWWQVFPVFVAGFAATFDFQKLLRFPLSLRAFYLLGLGYGFADFAAISSICWVVSMLAGAAVARFSILTALLPICVLFVLLNVTLERLLGSWLEKLLSKRRAREVFVVIFVLSMVSLNFLSPVFQQYGHSTRPSLGQYAGYVWWMPGSLAGEAVGAAATGQMRAVLAGVAGLLTWLAILSALLWQRFKAQYMGEEISESAAPERRAKRFGAAQTGVRADQDVARQDGWKGLSLLSPQVAAVMVKEFHYVTRNGFSFLTFLLPPIMVVFFSMQFTGKNSPLKEHAVSPEMFFPLIMAYLMLILLSPAYNSFSFEGKGIQTYFMAPIHYRDVLLGKNLLLVALAALELAVCMAVLVWRVGWPTMPRFFATLGAGVFAMTGQLTIANWSSLSFPKKIEIGKMKGQRNSGVAVWLTFGVQVLVAGISATVLSAGRWFGNPWLPLGVFVGLTIATVAGYVASLDSLDQLAEQKKELLIETLCR
jgi:ABC-2 type transport system permease protein